MSMDKSRMPKCPACGFLVWDYEPGKSSVVRDKMLWHPECAPASEPTHISETIADVLERADTPEEVREDATGWTQPTEPEDEGFRVVYSDEDIDQMEIEQNTIEIRPTETFISYDLPLKPESARTLALLEERYEHCDGTPLKAFYTESLATLHIPRSVRRKSYNEQVQSEAV